MTTFQNLQTIVISAGSTHVSSGTGTENGPSVDQRIDADNDGKVDYVVHRGTRTITFAKDFMTAKPQMCAVIAKTFKMMLEVRPRLGSDQHQFDAGKRFALSTLDQFRIALQNGESRREGGVLTFRDRDGIERSARDFETRDGRLAALTISGGDGKQVRIEDPEMLKAVQKALEAHPGGTLMAKRAAR